MISWVKMCILLQQNKHFLKHLVCFLSFSVFLSVSYWQSFVFNSSFYLRIANSVTYITHIEILISGPLSQFLLMFQIHIWNKYACKDCQSVMGHFKGTVKVHGAHNVTYKTFRKNSTQASCLLNLSQKIQ